MTYAQNAPAYRAAGFSPIPVSGKSPVPVGCTGHAGTVTDAKIADWSSSHWANKNIALRADGWISVDVDHYGDKVGATQLAELEEHLGLLPATITSTAREPEGPSRQHFFRVPPDLNFLTKPADDIEVVQASHRYAVVFPSVNPDSGSRYEWFDYDGQPLGRIPNISEFEELPEKWLEYLTTEPPAAHTGFVGSVKAWLDILPTGDPTDKVRRLIEDIPTNDFGHDILVKLTFRLVRLGAENHTGVHQALDTLHDAWTRPPYEEYAPALVTALEGAIRKAGKPQTPTPPLLRMMDVTNEISPELLELVIAKEPDRVNHRKRIVAAAYEQGLNDSQALTLAWNSAVGLQDQVDMDVDHMWREVQVARVEPVAAPALARETKSLLTDEERELVAGYEWWGTRYLDWVRPKVDYWNQPFHNLGRWAVLSTVCSPWGYTAIKGSRPTNCSLYMAIPAPSTVGKTDALGFIETCIDAYYGTHESPNLGTLGKLTSNALHRALLMRDGQASFVYTDEAQAFLRDIRENQWQGTLLGDLADYYGVGVIGAKQMMNDKEFSGVRGKTFLTQYMTGIDDQMADAMDLSMWTSGLFYRYIWAIADPREPDRDEEQADPTFSGEADGVPLQWAAEFKRAKELNDAMGKERMVSWDADAWARHNLFRRQMVEATKDHPRFERIINPALTRFAKSIIKCATLIALVEASPTVTLRHELIAIEQSEEWLSALVKMIDRTSESKFDREVEEVWEFIRVKPRDEAEVYRAFKPADRSDRILRQLEREKRTRRNGVGLLEVAA